MTRDQGDVLGFEGGKGLIARDRFGNFLQRRIVAGSMMVYVSEGDGETGNPYINVIPGTKTPAPVPDDDDIEREAIMNESDFDKTSQPRKTEWEV